MPWLAIDLAVKVAVVALSLYPLIDPDASHFAGKAMGFRALLYPAFAFLVPAIWLLARRPTPYPFLADILVALPFAVDAAGNVFGLFAIKGFDALPHASGWFFFSLAFGLAVAPLLDRRWIAFLLVTGFGASIDILWEYRGVPAHEERLVGPPADLREHDPGPGDVVPRRGPGGDRRGHPAVAEAGDTAVAVRLGSAAAEASKPAVDQPAVSATVRLDASSTSPTGTQVRRSPGLRLTAFMATLTAETTTATQISHGKSRARDGAARPANDRTTNASTPSTTAWTRAATRIAAGRRPGIRPPIA